MKAAGLIGGQFLIGISLRMVADDGEVDWVIKARSIRGATLESARLRLQVDMQTIDHGILEAGGLVGPFGQYLQSLSMMPASDVAGLRKYQSLLNR